MRLYEIEQSKSLTDIYGEGIEEFVERIKQECSEFLSYAEKSLPSLNLLYRGIDKARGHPGEFFSGESPTNRKPMSSSVIGQQMFDTALQQLGFTALRSNSIFVTSSIRQADTYGRIYMVFPINGFKYTYTAKKDIVIGVRGIRNLIDYESFYKDVLPIMQRLKTKLDQDPGSTLGSDLFKPNLTPEQIISIALNLISRLVDVPRSFGANRDDLKELEDFTKYLHEYVDPKVVNDIYQPSKENLDTAMYHTVEVLIHGKYHAIRYDYDGEKMIKQKLGLIE